MRRTVILVFFSLLPVLTGAHLAQAQDPKAIVGIYLKAEPNKAIPAAIAGESLQGLKLVNKAQPIAADEIFDIDYGNQMDAKVKITSNDPARTAEKAALVARASAERTKQLQAALAKYTETLQSTKVEQLPLAHRHIAFKIAYVQGLLSQAGDKKAREDAIAALKVFKAKNPDSWQLIPAMLLQARLQATNNDLKGAEATLQELAASNAPTSARQDARLQLIQVLMESEQYAEAQKRVQQLIADAPANSPFRFQARLAEAKCLAATADKLDPAVAKLTELLKETKDNNALHAAAYNTLGECYLLKNQYQDARWQFLWVDVIYNQDKVQHARALYHLWRIFDRLNEKERAQEFFDALLNGPQFAGLDYQRRAVLENKPAAGKGNPQP
jgi:hypothetical protein